MNAIEIIEKIKAEGALDKQAILAALEDGAALTALGITDADQEEVEDAHDLILNSGLNFTLNEDGQKELLAAIAEVAADKLIDPAAYFEDAENNAARWCNGESASIEISGQFTQSGNPEVILLKKEWFDYEICY